MKKQGIFEKRSGVLKKVRCFQKDPVFLKKYGVLKKIRSFEYHGVFKKVRSFLYSSGLRPDGGAAKDKSLGLNPYYVNGLRLNRT